MITSADVAITLGRSAPAEGSLEAQQWTVWIDDARRLITARLGQLELLDQGNLDYVVREAVAAQVRRPDDATQVDVAVDDSRVSRRYTTGTGRVQILDEWWVLLAPSTSGAFSVQPGFEPDRGWPFAEFR